MPFNGRQPFYNCFNYSVVKRNLFNLPLSPGIDANGFILVKSFFVDFLLLLGKNAKFPREKIFKDLATEVQKRAPEEFKTHSMFVKIEIDKISKLVSAKYFSVQRATVSQRKMYLLRYFFAFHLPHCSWAFYSVEFFILTGKLQSFSNWSSFNVSAASSQFSP